MLLTPRVCYLHQVCPDYHMPSLHHPFAPILLSYAVYVAQIQRPVEDQR